jgi:hypothetical protein
MDMHRKTILGRKKSTLPEASWKTWFNFYECSITDKRTKNICTVLDNFLVDIEAFTDMSKNEEAEVGMQKA